jgi:hypothetical protein
MEINTITLTVTPDELETIGAGLEVIIREEVKVYRREMMDTFNNDTISMLRTLIQAGYSIFIPGKGHGLDSRMCYDVDEFIDYLYREKDTTKEEGKKKGPQTRKTAR